jgi:gamma-F420-2:alpha-L-glutamate ligase
MIGWILGAYKKDSQGHKTYNHSKTRIIEEASKMGIDIVVYHPDDFEIIIGENGRERLLVEGQAPERLPDFVLPMTGAKISSFGLAVIHHLEHLGIRCFNDSRSIKMCKDKLYSQQAFAEHNLPVPRSMLARCGVKIDLVEKHIGFPVVVKALSGLQGKGVFLSDTKKNLKDLLQLVESINPESNLLLQEFISFSKGTDLRVITINDKAVACMRRVGDQEGFKANLAIDGSVGESYELTPQIEEIAVAAAKAVGLDIGGIDLLFTENGFKICEANLSPGLRGVEAASGVNIAKQILEHVQAQLAK